MSSFTHDNGHMSSDLLPPRLCWRAPASARGSLARHAGCPTHHRHQRANCVSQFNVGLRADSIFLILALHGYERRGILNRRLLAEVRRPVDIYWPADGTRRPAGRRAAVSLSPILAVARSLRLPASTLFLDVYYHSLVPLLPIPNIRHRYVKLIALICKVFVDLHASRCSLCVSNRLERCGPVVAAYIGARSRGGGLDQWGGAAGFKRSGNTGAWSRAARVIAYSSLVLAMPLS